MKKLIYPVLSLAFLLGSFVAGAQDEKSKERKRFEFVKEKIFPRHILLRATSLPLKTVLET